MDLSDPDILGAPCSAVDGAASLSSYVDSPFYAVLLALVFFFPLLDMSDSTKRAKPLAKLDSAAVKLDSKLDSKQDSKQDSKLDKLDSALSQSLCIALALFVVRTAASRRIAAPRRTVAPRAPSWFTPNSRPTVLGPWFTTHHAPPPTRHAPRTTHRASPLWRRLSLSRTTRSCTAPSRWRSSSSRRQGPSPKVVVMHRR